jgi:hypothetical protein
MSDSAIKRISLEAASKDELAAFVKQQASHIKTLEAKCVTLIEHYKRVQGERKELLEKYNSAAQTAEESQGKLETLPMLQNLCRTLEEKARTLEEERNAAALDGEAKQKLLDELRAGGAVGAGVVVVPVSADDGNTVAKSEHAALLTKVEELEEGKKALQATCVELQAKEQEHLKAKKDAEETAVVAKMELQAALLEKSKQDSSASNLLLLEKEK